MKIVLILFIITNIWANNIDKAVNAMLTGNDKKAIELLLPLVNSDNTNAQILLASIYKSHKEYEKAIDLYQILLKKGDSEAQYTAAKMYQNGEAVEQNYKKAARLMTMSSNQEYKYAQSDLGFMYLKGQGVEKNLHHTYNLWLAAAKNGHEAAAGNLEIFCKENNEICK